MHHRISEEITFRKLEVLLAYMETGNLSRAAELLDVSTVSVHRALHSLEEGVRCNLFRHEGRNLLPTDAAQVLAEVARDVLKLMANGINATRQAGGYAADSIRIGSLYSLTIKTVPTLIMGLKLRKPELQTELILGSNADLLQKLRQGVVDATLMTVPEGEADIESIALFDDDIYFAAPVGSRYANLNSVDLSSCADERFVSLTEGFATYSGFIEAFRVAGFTPNIAMKVGDIFSLMNLVSGGIGCTLLPGRVRDVIPNKVQLIPLQPRFLMRQHIGLNFLRTRERDPNLLALASVCRLSRQALA
ncbi:LysR family transcriptional regulator [Polaromonas glacialis]|uniref:LysR family transcriptional regulator n=1 Tax=Polaromonas glacialis TaxID=866564 RepID=UPI000497097D|nr:LysR family transcriptional regulator [Polaromonas glacialis]